MRLVFDPLALLLLMANLGWAQQQQAPAPCLGNPYTRLRLIKMVSDLLPEDPARAEYLIRTCAVRDALTPEVEADLKEAGATAGVIRAVREMGPKPEPSQRPKAFEVSSRSRDGLPYVYIPAGRFRMGCSEGDTECSDDEKPAHDVRISKGFWMGQTEVTVAAYGRYTRASGAAMPKLEAGWDGESQPVTSVSWTEADAYCRWAGLRLPTEAEWEYAARGGSSAKQYGKLDDIAWYQANSGGKPHDVGRKQANAFQLSDMLGNVWEWTADWYKDGYYAESPAEDPQGPSSGSGRVLRGGSWLVISRYARASQRDFGRPSDRGNFVGFTII